MDIEKIKDILLNGLKKLAETNSVELKNISIGFGVNQKKQLQCIKYIGGVPKLIDLSEAIGNNWFNFMVSTRLVGKLIHLGKVNGVDASQITLRAGTGLCGCDQNDVLRVYLYMNGQQIREVAAAELI